jgi:hypothetical protein
MTVLRPIIHYPALSVLIVRRDLSPSHALAREFVGNHRARSDALYPQQLLHQADSRFCTAAALNQDIEHGAVLVRGSQKNYCFSPPRLIATSCLAATAR